MRIIWITVIAFTGLFACKQVYNAPVKQSATGYLVVDGFINNDTQAITTIQLTRTTLLVDTANVIYEHNAQISIEGNANDAYPLSETGNGIYTSAPLTLNSSEKYRLRIKTADGKEYLSDSSDIRTTPLIDSISWIRDNNGIHLYVNANDPTNKAKYYQWRYEETWEFHSKFESTLVWVRDSTTGLITGVALYDTVAGSVNESIRVCWQSDKSTNILLGTTEKLSDSRIYINLLSIPGADWRLSYLYSFNVRQFTLSEQAYNFLQIMKKNTEQVGSIFDAQPSELKGNIHCLSNPQEIVVGFVEVTQERDMRIYISNSQVPGWGYVQDCGTPVAVPNNVDSIRRAAGGLYPTLPLAYVQRIVSFYAADPLCVVCTMRGTNVKPPFWP